MVASSPASTFRRALAVLVLATVALTIVHAPVAGAATRHRDVLLRMINESREQHDLRPVELDASLSKAAVRHTRAMLSRDRLFHPDLREVLAPYPWDEIGAAAVGCAGSLRALHRALLGSDVHRSILLHRRVTSVGIGVIRSTSANSCGDGSFWATEIFYG
jgi:uncharacterized protein YkwD